MCGICGAVALSGNIQSGAASYTKNMCDALIHRGPDDEGYYSDSTVALGMRRLKIIDLETGSQPVHNENKDIWVVFNGEIYNFPALREELIKKGHLFYTKSDTEVIVHLYEEYAQDCVTRMNGMFAFALWDLSKRRVLLARDRIGKKPLHYTQIGDTFIFASEIKAILRYPGVERQMDRISLSKYLAYEFVPAPRTIFSGIHKVSPAELLMIENGAVKKKSYWDIEVDRRLNLTEGQITERVDSLLEDAVKIRLISDVPIGIFLSGGIDSSAIVSYMSRVSKRKIKTFTIGFKEGSFDEVSYARRVADFFGTEHHERILEAGQMCQLLPKITDFLDEPLADASIIPTYLLSSVTKEDITVAIGGDGGDELFGGYPTYQAHRIAGFYERLPVCLRDRVINKAVERIPASFKNISLDFKAKKFISGISYPPAVRHQIWLGAFSHIEIAQLLKDPGENSLPDHLFSESIGLMNSKKIADAVEQAMFLDLKLYLQDDILVKVDRASMAASLEVRAPFLDYRLVELVWAIGLNSRLKGFTTKYILKRILKNRLPKIILGRQKKGFGIPVAQWVCGELKELVTDTLAEGRIKREGLFNHQYVARILKEHFSRKIDHRKKIWSLLMFELWMQKYLP
jgi:asparagine synthase (glutamine-hydrolysing)